MHKRYSHRFVVGVTALILCPTLFFAQSQIRVPEFVPTKIEVKQLSPSFFKLSTIGYWPAAVDWMWIQTLQISGGKNYSAEIIPSAHLFYDIATDLDPKFYGLYEQAGVLFSFFFHKPDESIHFLEKGIHAFDGFSPAELKVKGWSHPYTLHLMLAYVYAYEAHDWVKAKVMFLKAAEVPHAPTYLQNMKQWLDEKGSEKILARRVLTHLIEDATNPELKAHYEEKLRSMSGE